MVGKPEVTAQISSPGDYFRLPLHRLASSISLSGTCGCNASKRLPRFILEMQF
jgi:hypothetical protein